MSSSCNCNTNRGISVGNFSLSLLIRRTVAILTKSAAEPLSHQYLIFKDLFQTSRIIIRLFSERDDINIDLEQKTTWTVVFSAIR